jgi:L-fucose mutarotase
MDRVQSDKDRGLLVPAYAAIASVASIPAESLDYVERFAFYDLAKSSFVVIQTNDRSLYANVIIQKGVV